MFNAMMYTNCCALLADPGCCKSGPYLWSIDKRIKNGKVKKALIITLSDLKKNVLEEMNIQTPDLKGVVLSLKSQNDKILNKKFTSSEKNKDYDVYLSNYESMYSICDLIDKDYFDMVILDEAHRIGSPLSRQTKSIVEHFENTKYKYIVTGTLHSNNILSFFMPFRFLGADVIPDTCNYYEFRKKYMTPVDPDCHIWIPNSWSKDYIKKVTGNLSVCFTKEECLDLPELIFEKYTCELEGGQAKIYNQMKKDLVTIIDDMCNKCNKNNNCDNSCDQNIVAKGALVLSGKLNQICCGFYINTKKIIDNLTGKEIDDSNIITLNENPKLKLLISTLNNIPEDKQVIIWSNYRHSIQMICDELSKAFGKESFITCYGNQNAYEQVKLFQSSKVPYIVANQSKLGVGQNIQNSSYQIFFNNSNSYIIRDQAVGRQHRQGQKNKVTVIDLIVNDTVDVIRLKSLKSKQDLNLTLSQLSRVLKKPSEIDSILNNKTRV